MRRRTMIQQRTQGLGQAQPVLTSPIKPGLGQTSPPKKRGWPKGMPRGSKK